MKMVNCYMGEDLINRIKMDADSRNTPMARVIREILINHYDMIAESEHGRPEQVA